MASSLERLKLYNIFLRISSRRARGERGEEPKVEHRIITKFCASHVLFLIFIMKINMEEKSDFLITQSPLRPLRLYLRFLGVKNYGAKN